MPSTFLISLNNHIIIRYSVLKIILNIFSRIHSLKQKTKILIDSSVHDLRFNKNNLLIRSQIIDTKPQFESDE